MALTLTPDELAAAQAGDADLDTALGQGTTGLHPPLDAWDDAADYAQEGETAADVRSTWKIAFRAMLAATMRRFLRRSEVATSPTASAVPRASAAGKIDDAWIDAPTLATGDAIPRARADGTLDPSWVPSGAGTGPAKGTTEPPAVGYGTGTAGASDAYAPIDHTHDLAAHSHSYAPVSHTHSVTGGDLSEANLEEAADFLATASVGAQRSTASGPLSLALTQVLAGPFSIIKATGEIANISPIFGTGFARMDYAIPLLALGAAVGNHISVEAWIEVDGVLLDGSRSRWTVQQVVSEGSQHLTITGGGTIEILAGQSYDIALLMRVTQSTAAGDLVEIDAVPRLSIHAVESAV